MPIMACVYITFNQVNNCFVHRQKPIDVHLSRGDIDQAFAIRNTGEQS